MVVPLWVLGVLIALAILGIVMFIACVKFIRMIGGKDD